MGRRHDGYHLIESVFWPIDFVDELEIVPHKKLEVQAHWEAGAPRSIPAIPQQRENLVYRAAELALTSKQGMQMQIQIRKRVPIGAGLGGGSSNAGSLLRHLTEQGSLDGKAAEEAALRLGADVPFFLDCRPSWVEGIGEKRTALDVSADVLKDLHFLLVIPPEATPTPILFSRYRALRLPFAPSLSTKNPRKLDWKSISKYLATAENSLQGVAAIEYPLIADILSKLSKCGSLYAGLSGTGSTCFAVFRSAAKARKTAKDLQAFCRKSSCQTIVARTFSGQA